MTLEHTTKTTSRGTIDCNSKISPLTNPSTLAHEFAHVQFYHVYDSKGSAYPTYELRQHNNQYIHSPIHATPASTTWIEGSAFGIATAYTGSPTYQPAYSHGEYNFETRTHTLTDPRFAGKSFVDGIEGEGNIAAAIYDMIDTTNEDPKDDMSGQLQNFWNTLGDTKEPDEKVTAEDFYKYIDDWKDSNLQNPDNVLELNTLATPSCTATTHTHIFFDDFKCDLSKWVESGDLNWERVLPEEKQRPNFASTNMVANADNCDNDCILTMANSVDLSSYRSATVEFAVYLDNGLDRNEGLKLETSTDGSTWTERGSWMANTNDRHDNDTWTDLSVNLHSNDLQNNFKMRLVAESSKSNEEIEIDDVKITGTK